MTTNTNGQTDWSDVFTPDPDDTHKHGSSDTLGEIGPLEIRDDGASDRDVVISFDGDEMYICTGLSRIRDQLGDAVFVDLLDSLDYVGDTPTPTNRGSSATGTSSFTPRDPPAFSCRECHQTWPRSRNDGHDRCPNCSETADGSAGGRP